MICGRIRIVFVYVMFIDLLLQCSYLYVLILIVIHTKNKAFVVMCTHDNLFQVFVYWTKMKCYNETLC